MTLRELNITSMKEIMEFNQLCFPTDFWGRGRLAQAIRRRAGKGEVKYFCGETRSI